jgi:1-deoxy-D-xylulose-5-phosphate synthase
MSRTKKHVKRTFYRAGGMFEEMGFYYMGPVDGHDLKDLQRTLQAAKELGRPVLMHAITTKGKGYLHAEKNPDVFHGTPCFDPQTGKAGGSGNSFSKTAGDCLCKLAEEDPHICVITAAMTGGTGLSEFSLRYPKRFFDVGIAEGHAVTFLSGLASGGCLPIFAVYSTFLQRAYDQLLNDTAIMNNHIVLAVDRAGIVPDDGETHQGIFDVPFLSTIPNTVIYAPSTYEELSLNLGQALYDETGIVAVRYPRGGEFSVTPAYKPDGKPFTYFRNVHARTLIITYGRLFANAVETIGLLKEECPLSLLKLTRIYPIPHEVLRIAAGYQRVIFYEECSQNGGIAQQFEAALMERRFFGKYESHAIDGFIPTCSVADGLKMHGLDVAGMVAAVQGEERLAE